MSGCLALLAMLCLLGPPLAARPYGLDDLLRHEEVGQVKVDPTGRWLAFERLDAIIATARPDRIGLSHVLRARPYVVDLKPLGTPRPLLPDSMPPGTIILGFSPRGTQLAVARLEGQRFRLGLATMTTGAIAWLPHAPSYDGFHQILAWLSEDRLLLLAEDGTVPWALERDIAPDRVRAKWDATAAGRLAVTRLGSGRYLEVAARPKQQLLLLDTRSGAARQLARGHFNQMLVAPDGRSVALIEQARPLQPSAKSAVREDEGFFARTLLLVDVRSGHSWSPCPECNLRGDPRWGDAGRAIAFLSDEANGLAALIAKVDVQSIHRVASTERKYGATCPLSPDEGVPAAARSSLAAGGVTPQWEAPIHCPTPQGNDALVWNSVPMVTGKVGVSARLDGLGFVRLPGLGRDDVAEVAAIWLGSRATRLDGLGFVRLPGLGRGDVAEVAAIRLGSRAPASLLRLRLRSGETRLLLADRAGVHDLMTLNRHIRDVEPAIMRPLDHRAADGTPVTSWLVLPPWHRTGPALPLVVIPYPGQIFTHAPPADQQVSGERPYANAQLLAAAGFAVLLPSLPMPPQLPDTGFSFVDAIAPALGAALSSGCCDAARVAVWGHSYGGYAAAMAGSEGRNAYRAIIASAALYDLAGTVGTFGPSMRIAPEQGFWIASAYAWAEAGQGRMGSAPWDAPMRYVANSPVYHADRIRTPMLLIAADRDFSPLWQAEQLFSALFRQGKDAQLVTYWGEGHVVASPANLADLYRRVIAFLRDNLRPSPAAHAGP